MNQFNLKEALEGKPVVTRDGRKVTQLHLFKDINEDSAACVYAVVEGIVLPFDSKGVNKGLFRDHTSDLFMATEKITKWVRIYRRKGEKDCFAVTMLSDSEKEAQDEGKRMCDAVEIVKIIPITFEI